MRACTFAVVVVLVASLALEACTTTTSGSPKNALVMRESPPPCPDRLIFGVSTFAPANLPPGAVRYASPLAATRAFVRGGLEPTLPLSGWRVWSVGKTDATVVSGNGSLQLMYTFRETWAVESGSICR